jgi:hypothetical protein
VPAPLAKLLYVAIGSVPRPLSRGVWTPLSWRKPLGTICTRHPKSPRRQPHVVAITPCLCSPHGAVIPSWLTEPPMSGGDARVVTPFATFAIPSRTHASGLCVGPVSPCAPGDSPHRLSARMNARKPASLLALPALSYSLVWDATVLTHAHRYPRHHGGTKWVSFATRSASAAPTSAASWAYSSATHACASC